MFVGDQVPLDTSFGAARAGLAALSQRGSLAGVSEAAYGEGLTGLARVGPLGSVPSVSRLVEVRFRDLVQRDDRAGLALASTYRPPLGTLGTGLEPV